MSWNRFVPLATVLGIAVFHWCGPARAQVDFNYRGYIESDLRFAVPGKPEAPGVDEFRFIRNENWANASISVGFDSVRAVADLSLVFTGLPQDDTLEDLVQRHQVDPFRIESNALYVEVLDFVVPGLELRAGRQIVQWGTADYFNPTNNLNPYDLEDRLKFGEQVANEMLYLNYRFDVTVEGEDTPIFDDFNWSAVVVPYFRSPLLPVFGLAAFDDPSAFRQQVDSPTLEKLLDLQPLLVEAGGVLSYDVKVLRPDLGLDNMQYGTRLSWVLLGVDMSVSYFYGFDDVPRAEKVTGSGIPSSIDLNDPDSVAETLKTLNFNGKTIATGVDLSFPRMHVVGADFATSLDFMGGVGLWGEFAAVFHDNLYRYVQIGSLTALELDLAADTFYKWTVGMDYSITSWWYLNAQWVHGFIDEFGGKNLDDYIVAGNDFNLFANQFQLRFFTIINLQDLSYILFPQLTFKFWRNTEMVAGTMIYGGESDTKFGSKIVGPSTVFLRARYSF